MTYEQTVAAFRARATQHIADVSASLDGGGPGGGERVTDLCLTLSDFLVTLADQVLPQDRALLLIHLLNDQLSFAGLAGTGAGATPGTGSQGPSVQIISPAALSAFAPGAKVKLLLQVSGQVSSLEVVNGAGVSQGYAQLVGGTYQLTVTLPQAVGRQLLVARLVDTSGTPATDQTYLVTQLTLGVPGPPTNCVATPGVGGLQVTAKAPANNGGAAIMGYVVYRDGDLSVPLITGTGLPYLDATAGAAPHTYQVAATNQVGTGQPSAPSAPLGAVAEGVLFLDAQGDDAVLFLDAVAS